MIKFAIVLTMSILGGFAAAFGLGELGIAGIIVLFLAVDLAYFTALEVWLRGQTPGKRTMGLRVTADSGGRPVPADLMLRNGLRLIDGLPIFMVVGAVVAWIDPHGRRLGDLAAGTVVVAIPAARSAALRTLRGMRDRENAFAAPAIARRIQSRLTRDDRDLLADLAAGRDRLDPIARSEVFADAAAWVRGRFGLPDAESLSDEQVVLNVALVALSER